jgi:SAM-dependent methyltransferase
MSEHYWRRIFEKNPDFCSWQAPQQRNVLTAVRAALNEREGALRVLDFGVGSLGLYRALDEPLLQRIELTGITESQQHTPDDPLLARHRIAIATGPGLSPLADVANESQDYVLCTYVFAYLSAATRAQALDAFARVLAPGGRLLLVLHHPQGERARKFARAERFWPLTNELYERLLRDRPREARALLDELNAFLNDAFANDHGYRRYLASYLKTAARFLELFGADGTRSREIPEQAVLDCRDVQRCCERELEMTCRSFRPVADPARDLALPHRLALSSVVELRDAGCGAPIANLLTAHERSADASTA